jgi:mRNA interferase MazF
MGKDFSNWHAVKVQIDGKTKSRTYHEREIWWANLGINVGNEQDGSGPRSMRPVLIIKGISKETCFVLPLTTSDQENVYRVSVGMATGKLSKVILSQLRLIDARRLAEFIVLLDKKTFNDIRKSVKNMF